MEVNDDFIKKLARSHNEKLENQIKNISVPVISIPEKKNRKRIYLPDILTLRLKKLAFVYFSLILLFTFASVRIIDSVRSDISKPSDKLVNIDAFRSDFAVGIDPVLGGTE